MRNDQPSSIYFAIPQDSGYMEITEAGVIEFNFYEGRIVHPSGTVESMAHSLRSKGFKECNSLRIDSSAGLAFWFDSGGGARGVRGGDSIAINGMAFQILYIEAQANTYLQIFATTSPDTYIATKNLKIEQAYSSEAYPVTLGGSVAAITKEQATNRHIYIKNSGAVDVYIGAVDVTAARGFKLTPTDPPLDLSGFNGEIYALTAGAAGEVRVLRTMWPV